MSDQDSFSPFESKAVISNQSGIHDNLEMVVRKHLSNSYQKPVSSTQLDQFLNARDWQQSIAKPFILDCGCGTGMSTYRLAQQFPDHAIIGIDQSEQRLNLATIENKSATNVYFIRARLEEFWSLCLEFEWFPEKQYLFYPNPWPKKKHLQRRWHGNAIFPVLLRVCPLIELRTNWQTYALEFGKALELAEIGCQIERIEPTHPISRFEIKYLASGHKLYQIVTKPVIQNISQL